MPSLFDPIIQVLRDFFTQHRIQEQPSSQSVSQLTAAGTFEALVPPRAATYALRRVNYQLMAKFLRAIHELFVLISWQAASYFFFIVS